MLFSVKKNLNKIKSIPVKMQKNTWSHQVAYRFSISSLFTYTKLMGPSLKRINVNQLEKLMGPRKDIEPRTLWRANSSEDHYTASLTLLLSLGKYCFLWFDFFHWRKPMYLELDDKPNLNLNLFKFDRSVKESNKVNKSMWKWY